MYEAVDYPTRPADEHPETRRWIERIEAVRLEEASPRRCSGPCGAVKPLAAFARDRTKPYGRGYYCTPCNALRSAAIYRKRARHARR